jgi:TetR/AcrR family transcriptional repressor of nem operon
MRIHGYNGTGVKDIVDAAGVPKGSFYNYFESKEAFIIAALEQVATGNLNQMRRALGNSDIPPLMRVINFFVQNIEHLKRTERYTGGCFVGTICQETAGTNETIRRTCARILREYEQVFAESLREARAQGELAQEINPDALAGFIFNAWEGALLRMKADKSPVPLEQFLQQLKSVFK